MTRKKKRSRLGGALVAGGIALLGLAFIGTLVFLYLRARDDEPEYKTAQPEVTNIVKKAVATGSIVPRREVLIKPRVSGIILQLHVQPGDVVETGTLIADIKIVPNIEALTRAEAAVKSARIAAKHSEEELERAKKLSEKGLTPDREVSARKLENDLRKSELDSAMSQLTVAKEGAVGKSDETTNTKVRSTVTGTVLEVPVEVGGSVIETNNFNEGTTIASVADMSDMIFLGRIDEADVHKIKIGMHVNIKVGAIDDHSFPAKLEYIAPKGKVIEGAVQFDIKAAIEPTNGAVIRAGYSANAEIVLARRDKVLALRESLLLFEGDKPYVEVEVSPGKLERRDLQLGISDGINVEIKGGIEESDKVKEPEPKKKES